MTFPDTCREDDVIDTEAGEVTVVIANGSGYTVHPTRGTADFSITEDDCCPGWP